MRSESDRFATFTNASIGRVWAPCGFYQNYNLGYQCHYCQIKRDVLPLDVDPVLLHYSWNPFCIYILNKFGKPHVIFPSICMVCFDRERRILNLPCRHFTTCIECKFDTCVICRERIISCIEIFQS